MCKFAIVLVCLASICYGSRIQASIERRRKQLASTDKTGGVRFKRSLSSGRHMPSEAFDNTAGLPPLKQAAIFLLALNPAIAFSAWNSVLRPATGSYARWLAQQRPSIIRPRHRSPLLNNQKHVTIDEKRLPDVDTSEFEKEKHLLFDAVQVIVRSGAGGRGQMIDMPKLDKGKGQKLKRNRDGDWILPPGGGHGGNVVLYVDPAMSDLLHLRDRPPLVAERGGDSQGLRDMFIAGQQYKHVPEEKIKGALASKLTDVRFREGMHLKVPVPPGTFVRTSTGKVLGDLVAPGQELIVAEGGRGGPCMLRPEADTQRRKKKAADEQEYEEEFQLTVKDVLDMCRGGQPTELKLDLVLRTVADVGFVGFPNAGKSTLLRALSRASPDIQPYPFTTLMPNLGAMSEESTVVDLQGEQIAQGEKSRKKGAPLLADLPGLIEGACDGKGLGREFLRHLRRVSVVLYILDTTCPDNRTVSEQYNALRRELELYNPRYMQRPHVVALSKLDIPLENGGEDALAEVRKHASRAVAQAAKQARNTTALPVAIVPISGLKGKGLKILREAIDQALEIGERLKESAGTGFVIRKSLAAPVEAPTQRQQEQKNRLSKRLGLKQPA